MSEGFPKHLVIYDGECKFCHWCIDFIIKQENKESIQFAWLQDDRIQSKLSAFNIDRRVDSLILIDEGKPYVKSQAAFRISAHLNRPYRWLRFLNFLPTRLTDVCYDFIARHRKKIMGSTTECVLPIGNESRFF